MNTQSEGSPNTQLEPQFAGSALAQAAVEVAVPTDADRLYQFAALTAGIFLLATLL